jgi:NAD(P)H-hydrate epimerase
VTELPAWLTPLLTAASMRASDRWAIEQQGVPGIELMERAGNAALAALERLSPDGPVTVLCGKGNNGGDGLVVARLLRAAGREARVVCVASPREFKGDAQVNLERLPGAAPLRLDGLPWEHAGGDAEQQGSPHLFARGVVLVDALLGTGFEGEPRGAVAEAIALINHSQAPVLSIDVPSGVDSSTGEVAGAAVHAALTTTFHAAKPGLWINPGKAHAGEVEVCDIGIPRGAPHASSIGLMTRALLGTLPRRSPDGTKFTSGHVLVVGGSRGLTGAPTMSARASMRAGAGYVTACVPASLQAIVAGSGVPELMTRGLPEDDGSLTADALALALEAGARGGAIALGPGLGRQHGAFEFARSLARAAPLPLVLDADGLNAHAGRLSDLRARSCEAVLTPHAGELARLLECDSAEIERHRLRSVRAAAEQAGAVVLLKGDDTLVARPDGVVAVSPGASPALATAGTGDVLTGVIAALLSERLDAFTAACAGVWVHAQAGREAARRVGAAEGVIASDVIEALPSARAGADAAAESGRERARG